MIQILSFDELTARQIYEILKLRSAVFVVEQQSCYLDPDDIDYQSIHIFEEDKSGAVTGCVRIFPAEKEGPGCVQIGRLVTKERRTGLGRTLMQLAEETAKERYQARSLYLTGRESALGFYEKCGFSPAAPKITGEYGDYYILRKSLLP